MQCPKCHFDCPPDFGFCPKCGTSLLPPPPGCPKCGFQVPPDFAFCPKCGTPQGAAAPPPPPAPQEQADATFVEALKRMVPKEFADRLLTTRGQATGERRLVTILFSDVKGSTAMAEKLDPEDVMDIMNEAFEVLIPPVYHYEGTLARLMGDAILAFFGAPIAHENDPERACRAALEIVAGAQKFAVRLAQERGIPGFNVRVGINTGLVVVGEVGTDLRVEYTAMGDAINLAARMEQSAPVGGILISHNTYQLVRGLFEMQALEPIAVKGKSEPVPVYTVQRAKPRAFRLATRGIEGVETPMVGREGELKKMQELFYTASEDRERQMLTIVADAGVGKTRLLYEFEGWLEQQPAALRYLRGRASSELQHVPYALLRDVLVLRCEIQESDPAEVVRAKLEQGLGEVLGRDSRGQAKAHLVGQLLGFDYADSPHVRAVGDDARQLRDRALIYLREFLQGQAALATVVLLLEDIHWADDSSLDAVSQLAQALPEARLLIVCLARPALYQGRPHWGEGQMYHTRLELQPLSKHDVRRLIDEILRRVDRVPAALRDLVIGGAEGNPLYVEELIKMLLEEGVIVKGPDRWRVLEEKLVTMRVPPTLTGVLQARLDSLPLKQRSILQQAAVVGRTFWDRVVARIAQSASGEVTEEEIPATLDALRSREMVARRETSSFGDALEFIFRHAALREVAYESILKKLRRTYHSLVAEWLIEQGGERAAEYTGLIAEHLEAAGRAAESLPYMRRAGEQAAAQYANQEAVGFFTRALALLAQVAQEPGPAREQEYALLLGREGVYRLQGKRDVQAADLARLSALAEEMGADQRRAEVALRYAAFYEATSNFPASVAAVQQAVQWAEQSADPRQKAAGLVAWGIVLWRQGKLDESRARLEEALALAREQGDRPNEATSLHNLGTVSYIQGDLTGAHTCLEQALEIRRALGDRRREAASLNNLMGVHLGQGDLTKARLCNQQALAISQAIGDQPAETKVFLNLAVICHALGNFQPAREHNERALALMETNQDRGSEALALKNMGLVFCDLGEPLAAKDRCERALALDRETGNRKGEGYSLTYLGLVLEKLGEWDRAAEVYQEALRLCRELGQAALSMDNLAGLARVALAQARLPEATRYVQEAQEWIAAHGVQGIDYPVRVYLTVVDVLKATGQDEQARAALSAAEALVQERAARISDEADRRTFLENVPLHAQLRERLGG